MPAKVPWVERSFSFDFPVRWYPDFIERMRGTPARIEEKVRLCPSGILTKSDGRGWSIQENIGHLLALEPLFESRIDDFLAGKAMLRAADMTNLATSQARYNEHPIDGIVAEFRRERHRVVARLEALPESDFARVSIHPRLNKPMRLVDAAYFVACHDDYHLARMTELARHFAR